MKYLIVVFLVTILTGCGAADRFAANITGSGSESCWKGVVYVQFTSGASVAYNTDGTVMLCD